MTHDMIIGCPKCGRYRGISTKNIVNLRFKCFKCDFATIRKAKDKFGNANFKLGFRKLEESIPDAVMRLNGGE